VVSIEGTGEQPEPEQTSVGIGKEESRLSKAAGLLPSQQGLHPLLADTVPGRFFLFYI